MSEALPKHEQVPEQEEQFTEDEIKMLAEMIFNRSNESVIDESVRFYTGQDELEGYQKVLLSPANAVESLLKFGVKLFDSKTYKDIADSVDMIQDPETRQALKHAVDVGWENMTDADKAAFVSEIAFSSLFAYGGVSKLFKVLSKGKGLRFVNEVSKGHNRLMLDRLGEMVTKTGQTVAASPLDDAAVVGGSVASQMSGKMASNEKSSEEGEEVASRQTSEDKDSKEA